MFRPAIGLAALASAYASGAHAQATWAKGQVNTTICEWQQLRGERFRVQCPQWCPNFVAAHVVRDTVYMDGGSIWWLPGMDDGTFAPTIKDSEYFGAAIDEQH